MEEFVMPDFLKEQSAEEIMERMVERLPDDIDVSEGNHVYNLLMPTAVEKKRFIGFFLQEAIKLIFPQYCAGYDEMVDYHAQTCGLKRKSPFYASVDIKVTGETGTIIPPGTRVSTASVNEIPSVEFETVEEAIIDESGCCQVAATSVEPGEIGNVGAKTILFSDGSLDGIGSVTNLEAAHGGVEEESTESLIQRIVEYERNQGLSFVGCNADYKRWAEEVDGAGTATVIPPADDSGRVSVILTDSEGNPATESLCQAVYEHIMRPGDPSARLAPINALLSVMAPVMVPLSISAEIELTSTYAVGMVKEAFLMGLKAYLKEVPKDREVRYSKVYAVLSRTEGVEDIGSFAINGGTGNVPIREQEFPSVEPDSVQLIEIVD